MQHDFILLDRSGSMEELWKEALGSVNAYVDQLAKDGTDTGVTVIAFDQHIGGLDFSILRDRITPKTMLPITSRDATPRGGTPLNDAVGKMVALADAGGYDKVSIIIMTDGHENASKELTTTAAKALLDRCRAKGWAVIFLGANFDNAAQAVSFGNAAQFTASAAKGNMENATRAVASKRYAYGQAGATAEGTMGFTPEEKAKLAR